RAELTAGRSNPTRMPMMLITTSSSISVKPRRFRRGLIVRPFRTGRDGRLVRLYSPLAAPDKGFQAPPGPFRETGRTARPGRSFDLLAIDDHVAEVARRRGVEARRAGPVDQEEATVADVAPLERAE